MPEVKLFLHKNYSLLVVIFFVMFCGLSNGVATLINARVGAVVGVVIGLFGYSFALAGYRRVKFGHIYLLVSATLITSLSALLISVYCSMNQAFLCQRNPIILSALPGFIILGMWCIEQVGFLTAKLFKK